MDDEYRPIPKATQLIVLPQERTLPELTEAIQSAHGEVMRAFATGAAAAIAAGKALIEAKALLRKHRGHGSWQDYVAIECRLGVRTAQVYMHLAKHEAELAQLVSSKTQGSSFISQAEALKLLGMAKEKKRRKAKKLTKE